MWRRIQNPVEPLWWNFFVKSQESIIVDVRLGSKYASGIGFTAEKVYRM